MIPFEKRTLYAVRQIETLSPAQFTWAVKETTRAFAGHGCVLQPMLRTIKTEKEVNIMDDFKDLKEAYAFNDEELDDVVGGMKTFSVHSTDTSKSTAVLGNGDGGTNAYRCPICNSPEIMDHEAFFAHIKIFHPEEYH